MSLKRKIFFLAMLIVIGIPLLAHSANEGMYPWDTETVGRALGWVINDCNFCGGYFVDQPFIYPVRLNDSQLLEITSNQGVLSQKTTSILEDEVTINRDGQQITANKAFVYRDPVSHKINIIELQGDVHIREPNTLIIAQDGKYNIVNKAKSLNEVLYRTALSGRQVVGPSGVPNSCLQNVRLIDLLSGWGSASSLNETEPKVYEMYDASFSTCPPTATAWQMKADHIVLDKNIGRGYATNARLMVRSIPVLYTPYISFSIDKRRKSGFLWPTIGVSNKWGPYVLVPYYWNMAPNYDMVITPGLLSKRGIQFSDYFRYLTHLGEGSIRLTVLPNDREYILFKQKELNTFGGSLNPVTQAELNRLLSSSNTRKSLYLRNNSRFNDHWSGYIDFSYVGDDYYLKDFGNDLNEITENQLLQEGDIYGKGENWLFVARLQAYQTLHPLDSTQFQNAYRRLPQLILNIDYPDQPFGLEYFITSDVTHFEILNDPGTPANKPVGNRLHLQPGISLPINYSYFFFNPRVQIALTDYNLYQTKDTETPKSIHRAIPIVDILMGLLFRREVCLFNHYYASTLEPQFYYTYIPFRDQQDIPIFDTTVNTLTYDQIFNYNRFTGIDRIGDTHQIAVGITSRLIDSDSGFEKVRFGIGNIVYFVERRVTLCQFGCSDNPNNHSNKQRLSPVSAILNYNINPVWGIATNAIWDPISKQLNNSTIAFHYQPESERIINVGFSYAREGDILSGIQTTDSRNNLKVTDISFVWPLMDNRVKLIGRWSQNLNHNHLQNLLYGLQYDSCCWAIRLGAGRAFTGLDAKTNQFTYSKHVYLEFALKGLGNIGTGNPSALLRNITGYTPQFGQEL